MKRTHQTCRCEVCITHPDTAVCDACHVTWPCDAEVGRAALERIEALAESWGVAGEAAALGRRDMAVALLVIRDQARAALGGQTT